MLSPSFVFTGRSYSPLQSRTKTEVSRPFRSSQLLLVFRLRRLLLWNGSWGREIVHQDVYRLFCCPCNAAQQHPLNLIVVKVLRAVPLHPDEDARGYAARQAVFIGPDLWNHFAGVLAGPLGSCNHGSREHMNPGIVSPGHVVERLIEEGKIRHSLHDGAGFVDDGVGHRRRVGVVHLSMLLAGAYQGSEIRRIGTAKRIVKTDNAAAP